MCRKSILTVLLIAIGLCLAGSAYGASVPQAALIVKVDDLSWGFDGAMYDRLVSMGYDVTVVTGGDVKGDVFTAADAETFDVLVVSESISSSAANNLIGANVPMMHQESYGWSRHYFTAGLKKSWVPVNGMMDVVNDTHPICVDAGLSVGPLDFFTDPNVNLTADLVSALAPGAVNLAQVTSDANDFTLVFAIEQGAELANGTPAANRIVGFSLPGTEGTIDASVMTDDAWAFFEAAIRWLDPAPTPIPPMVAHWPMDDGAGTVVTDVVGGNNGEMVGLDPLAAWIDDGKLGGAMRFDNTDGHHIVVPHSAELDFGDVDFSISMLIRYPPGVDPTGQTDRWIIKGTHGAPGTGSRYELFHAANERIRFSIDNGPANVKSRIEVVPEPFITGDWVHVVIIRDAVNDQLSIYANGVQPDVIPGGDTGVDMSGDISSSEDLWIGESTDETGTAMIGDIDDVRIFPQVLTEDEIAAIASLY